MAGKPKHDSIMQTIATADSELATVEQEYAAAERAWTLAKQRTRSYEDAHPKLKPFAFFNGRLATLIRYNIEEKDPELRRLRIAEAEAYRVREEKIGMRRDIRQRLGLIR